MEVNGDLSDSSGWCALISGSTVDWNLSTEGNPATLRDGLPSGVSTEQLNVTQTLILLATIVVVLWVILANVIVMACISVDKKLRSATMNMYVFSLAIADALVGLCVMPFMVVYILFETWPLGSGLCIVWLLLEGSLCPVSIFHLCLIAHDRWVAQAKPFEYQSTTSARARRTALLIGAAWVFGLMLWVPAITTFGLMQDGLMFNQCFIMTSEIFLLVQSTVVYYLPIIALVLLYIKCVLGLKEHFTKIHVHATRIEVTTCTSQVTTSTKDNNTSTLTSSQTQGQPVPGNSAESTNAVMQENNWQESRQVALKAGGRQKEHARGIRTIGVVIVTFFVCWLPFCIFMPIVGYCFECIPPIAFEYSIFSAYLNSAMNPCIYFMANRDFRKAFKTLLRKMRIIK